MNKTLIFRKIGGIISEISEQHQYLAADPENINPLELELFVANSHFLSEHLAILKKLSADPNLGNVSHFPKHVQLDEPLLSMTIPGLESDDQPDIFQNFEPAVSPEPNAIIHEPNSLVKDADLEVDQEKFFKESEKFESPSGFVAENCPVPITETIELPATFISEPEPVSVIQEAVREVPEPGNHPLVAAQEIDLPTEDRVPTLNEILSAGRKTELVSLNITQNQEKDLKSMIKLNDKLMFVRDLFNGYSLAYSEAIDFINRLESFEAADKFLKHNYADKNRWPEKQNSVDQFYEVLSRRFS